MGNRRGRVAIVSVFCMAAFFGYQNGGLFGCVMFCYVMFSMFCCPFVVGRRAGGALRSAGSCHRHASSACTRLVNPSARGAADQPLRSGSARLLAWPRPGSSSVPGLLAPCAGVSMLTYKSRILISNLDFIYVNQYCRM